MTSEDLNLYLLMVSRRAAVNRVDVAYHGATDMEQKLDQMAVQAMAQYHHTHHFKLKFRPVGNEMVYWGECDCGETDS